MRYARNILFSIAGILSFPGFAHAASGPACNDTGTTAWMLTSTTLVLLMVPGLAMFYGGLVRTKNVLSTMMHCFAAMAIIGVIWPIVGYALSFGHNVAGGFVGWNREYFFLRGLDGSILPAGVPEYVFAMFQGKFAIITPALIAGAIAERVRFLGYCIFIALWSLLVYCPVCHWVWAPDGYLFNLGAMGAIDFAGGTVVHISSGVSALVLAIYIGRRRGYPQNTTNPNNIVMTLMGAGLLWVGWFGFNAGSAVSSGLDTARALTVTQISAASGALTWMLFEAIRHGKVSSLGVVSGIVAGLVAITPAAGAVTPAGAVALGAIAALFCSLAISFKNRAGYDDTLDVFGIHGVGGITGALFLTFFIRKAWWTEATSKIAAWSVAQQLLVQVKAVALTIGYAAVATLVLAFIIEKTVGFRVDSVKEMAGLDQSLHGEAGYGLIHLS